jgi:hypothetical protein
MTAMTNPASNGEAAILSDLGHPTPTTAITNDTPHPSSAIPHNSSVLPES